MTTCPRCGRVADDEFVCADCGAFLAGGQEGAPAAQVSIRRVALLVLVVCLLGAGGAVALLHHGGSSNAGLPGPLSSTGAQLSSAPLGAPGGESSAPDDSSGTGSVRTGSSSANSRAASSSASSSPRSSRSKSSAPSSSAPGPTVGSSTAPSSSPRPTTSQPSTTRSTTAAPPPPTVQLAKGAGCGPHCFVLVVSLRDFPAGSHHVACWSGHAGQFGGYSTSSTTSTGCSYDHPHDTVWVVVDGHSSNTVTS